MKTKKLKYMALITMLANAGAWAQTSGPSVTVYGLLDTGVVRASGGSGQTTYSMDHYHTSRIGFKGNENLGDGLNAFFKLESRFLTKNGTQQDGATLFNDETYVGISKANVGTLKLGRVYSPFYLAVAGRIDPFNGDGVGSMTGWSSIGHNLSPGNPYDTAKGLVNRDVRTNNAVDYTSPSLNGFTLQLQTSFPDANTATRQKAVVVKYDSQAFFGETGYERKAYSTSAYTAHVGGGINWGPAKLSAGYAWGYYSDDEEARGNKASSILLGMTYAIDQKLNLLAAIAKLRMDKPTLLDAAKGTDSNATKFAVGLDYAISARTTLFAHYAHVSKPLSILFVSTTSKEMVGIDHKF